MCGIAGIVLSAPHGAPPERLLEAMSGALAHRGPDAGGVWTAPGVGLVHRRLSIIDLVGGDQPIGNEDGRVQVVFNGELYNYRELRRELESRGHSFRTQTDTEVLVHLYEDFGPSMVERLRGMFAFGLWDDHRQELLLGRDRIGLKPLYYYRDSQRLLFASELKAIVQDRSVPRDLDLEALEDYLAFGMVSGERSIFRAIRKLPAAHILRVGRSCWDSRPTRYWRLDVEPNLHMGVAEWIEGLDAKLHETVLAHRIADVPIGAFLSGGLDSSAVVALLCRDGTALRTFSAGFREEAFSELPYARRIAQTYGTEHIELVVASDAARDLDQMVYYFDEPFADSSAIPTMAICRAAREHVKVVLSGDGGDEAFGGYQRYPHDLKEARLRQLLPRGVRRSVLSHLSGLWPKADWLPRVLRLKTLLTNLSLDAAEAYANTLSIFRSPLRRQLLHPDVRAALNGYRPEAAVLRAYAGRSGDPLAAMIATDIDLLLPDDFLTKVDRASMAVGLEVRPPLVDHELLELAATIPSPLKVRGSETKWLFKRFCRTLLPSDIVDRPKKGFEIPVDAWLEGPLREVFQDVVLAPSALLGDYVDQNVARRLFRAHCRGTGRHGAPLWALLVLGKWMEMWCRREVGMPNKRNVKLLIGTKP